MAKAAEIRQWLQDSGRPQVRGTLPKKIIEEWDANHPDDPYERTPARGAFIDADDMESMFPDMPGGDGLGDLDGLTESKPRPVPKARKAGGSGFGSLFGGKQQGKARKKQPRISTESLLGSVWRGAAKLATPLPPLHRTLRVQAPVAGMLLEDAVRDTAADAVLQPFARMAEAGKAVSALLGPPLFVTGLTLHVQQRAVAGLDPHPVFLAIAQEGLRSSLMTWMDVAGPKFVEAVKREREFEEKYGADVDQFMAWLFSPPPSTAEEAAAEEAMFRRTMGIDDPVSA